MSVSQEPGARRSFGRVHWTTVMVAVILTLGILIYLGYGLEWTGFGPSDERPAKTLWEWLSLLIVPAMLVAGGFLLNRWQMQRDEAAEQAQKQREELAAIQRAQDEAMRAYLDQMSDLMVEKKMRNDPAGSDTHRLAQARTIAILLGLDRDRKRRPLKLIYELSLIPREQPILNLSNAGLDTADLSELTLRNACLREADLRCADLSGADLRGSDLSHADLRGADLTNADLSDTCLAAANLLPYDRTKPAKYNAPNLSNGTDPTDVDLANDHLVVTNLDGANLKNADVSGAFLTGASVTDEQLESCASLRGAILPDGRRHD